MKVLRDAGYAGEMAAAAARYIDGYTETGLDILDAEACRQTGCLMLARIDGDSPVEYLDAEPHRSAARNAARSLIADPPRSLALAVSRILEFLP